VNEPHAALTEDKEHEDEPAGGPKPPQPVRTSGLVAMIPYPVELSEVVAGLFAEMLEAGEDIPRPDDPQPLVDSQAWQGDAMLLRARSVLETTTSSSCLGLARLVPLVSHEIPWMCTAIEQSNNI
ncbi:hypothetical protein HaLaN_32557, partial [Haematococcus lacustris]